MLLWLLSSTGEKPGARTESDVCLLMNDSQTFDRCPKFLIRALSGVLKHLYIP